MTGRQVGPLLHPLGKDASFCEEKKEDTFPGTQGRKALPRLLERGRKRSRSRLFHQSSLGRRNRGNINRGECTVSSTFSYKSTNPTADEPSAAPRSYPPRETLLRQRCSPRLPRVFSR